MELLLVLVLVTLLLAVAGRPARWARRMFTVTGLAHFDVPPGMRAELLDMVPPGMPAPGLLVALTGALELAGAAGLLWTGTSRWAAAGLAALLVAVFPANLYKAATDATLRFDDQLLPRAALQVVFPAAAVVVRCGHRQAMVGSGPDPSRRGKPRGSATAPRAGGPTMPTW